MNVRVNADPDSERTVFNNRNLTLSGASVWFHGSRQSCLNITLTLLVPHWGAPPHRLHSSYFYWRQEEFVSKYGCVRLSPCEAWKWLLQVRVMCAMFMLVKRKYLFSGNMGWVVWGGEGQLKHFLGVLWPWGSDIAWKTASMGTAVGKQGSLAVQSAFKTTLLICSTLPESLKAPVVQGHEWPSPLCATCDITPLVLVHLPDFPYFQE